LQIPGSNVVRYRAAGGVVVDGERVLVLRRPGRGEVRLPKGHIDPGETPRAAALREVGEESGYADLEIVADLGTQTVEFDWDGRHYVRDEHYFLMQGQPLKWHLPWLGFWHVSLDGIKAGKRSRLKSLPSLPKGIILRIRIQL